jgi:phosphatidylethanolamine/phosphatidyl-N-methylethanolamine N-methyltransferase
METLELRHDLVRNNLRFLKLWLQRPTRLGAVLPSSRSLAAAMAAEIDKAAPGAVVELGGGTGNITAALLDSGTDPRDIVVIEREASLCRVISRRFPQIRVICGDATKLRGLLRRAGIGPVKAVVSGLPFLAIPKRAERLIVAQAFDVLADDGVLIQFTYGPKAPISRSVASRLDIAGDRSHWVLDNLPPAAVWQYRRRADSRDIAATA